MTLRPHHLLCIGKFTGHGYDSAFTNHMTEIVSLLRGGEEVKVTLVCGVDELCGKCPNRRGSLCSSQDKVTYLDAAVLDALRIPAGTYGWAELTEAVRERIYGRGAFDLICESCEWFPLCGKTKTNY